MKNKAEMFKAYDIRAIYPHELDEHDARNIGASFATLNSGKVVVGSDARLSSPSLKKELITGLLSTGTDVIDIGMIATPMMIFAVNHFQCTGGIVVTASHNPKEFNGFKFFDSKAVPISYETGLKALKDVFFSQQFIQGKGQLVTATVKEDYADYLLKNLKFKTPPRLKVVVDTANGSPGIIYPYVLKKLDIDVHELFTEPDGNFPNHHPDPSKPENLRALQHKVIEVGADLGVAYDGDGDRLGVIDEKGRTVYVGTVFSILIKSTLESKPQSKVVVTVIDSQAIDDTITTYGGQPVLCRVGHTYITQKMVAEDAMLAGEVSGHYYFDETYKGDDALFATLKLIEYLTNTGKKISEFTEEFPHYSEVSERLRLPIKENEKFSFVKQLINELLSQGYNVNTLDGVKVFLEDGWALFRPSNTEAKISIAYEAKSKKGFDKIKNFVNNVISQIPQ
ncbi:MAG: phosphomannomutase/phosphoglucomutase [Candidatus Ranarchaeia archaeon]|jgi:phosphomannomutase/phosphoglucomutase